MADIGKEVGLELIEISDLLVKTSQFFIGRAELSVRLGDLLEMKIDLLLHTLASEA